MTETERRLWRRLRMRDLEGHKFRRQRPIGPYIVDFVCLTRGLIIEVDGGQHAERAEADAHRTAYLTARGFRVLRFWNNEVSANLEGVCEAIARALYDGASGGPPS